LVEASAADGVAAVPALADALASPEEEEGGSKVISPFFALLSSSRISFWRFFFATRLGVM
jgi:hypothetical protein